MKNILRYFSDVLIIDTSHKTNRFNLPLLDIAVVSNIGKTLTCFIGLLEDQTSETFIWALENFKNELQFTPKVIFSDEDDALIKGKNFI